MPDGEEEPAEKVGYRDAAWHRELAHLLGVYLDALACTDARATDPGFLRSRASLGAILRVLGVLHDRPAALPGREPGTAG